MIMATAIGTLTRNAARQEIQSVRAPPTSRPKLAPMPAVAPYQATARPRASFSKYAVINASEVGATIAAPTPCTARPAIIHHPAGASPISSEAVPKTASPITNSRRRPTMSPARAASRSNPPKTSVYASCTQDSSVGVNSSPARMLGNPVKITELSSRIMK
jgi:hypothetical protein